MCCLIFTFGAVYVTIGGVYKKLGVSCTTLGGGCLIIGSAGRDVGAAFSVHLENTSCSPLVLGGSAVYNDLRVRDRGHDTAHWEDFGQIPPQGDLQADR